MKTAMNLPSDFIGQVCGQLRRLGVLYKKLEQAGGPGGDGPLFEVVVHTEEQTQALPSYWDYRRAVFLQYTADGLPEYDRFGY